MRDVNLNFSGAAQGTPSGLYDVQASSAEWDVIMNNLSPAPKPMRIVSTPSGRTNKKQVHVKTLPTSQQQNLRICSLSLQGLKEIRICNGTVAQSA